jgi:hypothetical protein
MNWRCTVNLLEEKTVSMVAIKNILFATDFSDVSEAALPICEGTQSTLRQHGACGPRAS